jgi:hypothetical protein
MISLLIEVNNIPDYPPLLGGSKYGKLLIVIPYNTNDSLQTPTGYANEFALPQHKKDALDHPDPRRLAHRGLHDNDHAKFQRQQERRG